MPFAPFELERLMSEWEQRVDHNLSESGVHPLTLAELLHDPGAVDDLLAISLNYPQVNGTLELRERVAALYPGATPDHVLVTVGCAEANHITLHTVTSPGDEVVVMLPNYLQIWGLAKNSGLSLRAFRLREEAGWAPDPAELAHAVTGDTRLIAVCNPNNPTGYTLTEAEMDLIVAAAERSGAWILADEVYAGAERLTDVQTPSFWGRYDRVLALNSTSKAYGLPGLRLGWVVAPTDTIDAIWRRHEYATISASALSNALAAYALSPDVRPRLIRRGRAYIRRGFPVLTAWLERHQGLLSLVPPQAAAIAFVRYHIDINSTILAHRLIRYESVLVGPGDHFGLDGHLRVSFGLPPTTLKPGLDRISRHLDELRQASAVCDRAVGSSGEATGQ
jgi:aspartate/methionine/tyrosine aminotransferase